MIKTPRKPEWLRRLEREDLLRVHRNYKKNYHIPANRLRFRMRDRGYKLMAHWYKMFRKRFEGDA